MGWFDVHAHLTDPRLAADEAGVLARAAAAGVTTIISNGLNPADNTAVLALAARSSIVRPALGLYPVDAVLPELLALGVDHPRDAEPLPADDAIGWLRDHVEQAFAVGEIGLDHHWVPQSLWALQAERFERLVRLAIDADKPIIIHSRRAERDTLDRLVALRAPRVNWHCFGGKVKLARQIAEVPGHYLSIPANARRSESFTRMIQTLPRERILLETDCPYLSPQPGTINEPANVAGTAAYLAEQWDEPLDAVQARVSQSFADLFRADP